MASRAKTAADAAADTNAGSTDGSAGGATSDMQDTETNGAPEGQADEAGSSDSPDAGTPQQVEQPEQPSLPERLLVLGLDLGSDDMVALTMLTSMEGPSISLSRNDPHRCDPEEAIRLVQARFAKPA